MPLPTHTLEPASDAPSLPDFPHFPTDRLSLGSHLDRSSLPHTFTASTSSIWGLHWIGTECHFKHTKLEPAPDVPSLTALTRLTQSTDMLCPEPHVCPESPTTTPRRQRKNAIATTVSTPTEPPQKPRESPAKNSRSLPNPALTLSPEQYIAYSTYPIPIYIHTHVNDINEEGGCPRPESLQYIPESSRDARCSLAKFIAGNTLDDP